MTIITAPLLSAKPISNLDSYQYTVQSAGLHLVAVTINEQPPSGITVTIAQAGSASVSVSSPSPAAAESVINLSNTFNCQPSDTLTVTVASSQASDKGPQSFKGLIRINIGSSN